MTGDLCLFALQGTRELGEGVARALGMPLDAHEERGFEDGEHKARPLVNVRGRDVFVIHSLYGEPGRSVNDRLCRLLFFLGAVGDAAAGRVTAVVPYLCYARKDQKTKPRDPVTTRYVAALFEAVGVDRIVTLDVHNLSAFQNAFRGGTEHLEARPLFVRHLAAGLEGREVAVVSPDVGGIKRAESLREALSGRLDRRVASGFMDKQRSEGVVTGDVLVGGIEGRTVLLVDDLIATGTTMRRAVHACLRGGGEEVWLTATHGLFLEGAADLVGDPAVTRVVVSSSVPPFRLDPALVREKVEVLEVAPLFAEAIRRMHEGGSLAELLKV